jgi:hypothetical protein
VFTKLAAHLNPGAARDVDLGRHVRPEAARVPLHDKAFHDLTEPAVVIPIVLGIAAITGIKTTRSRRDRLTASVVGGTIGAVICAPP